MESSKLNLKMALIIYKKNTHVIVWDSVLILFITQNLCKSS